MIVKSFKAAFCAMLASITFTMNASAGERVIVAVGGDLQDRCSISLVSSPSLSVDLASSGTATFDFDLNCNHPIEINLESRNGYIAIADGKAPETNGDYTGRVDYTVDFSAPLKAGTWSESGIAGSTLQNGTTFRPGSAALANSPPFDSSLEMTVNWDMPTAKLLAGYYSEEVTVTVTGREL